MIKRIVLGLCLSCSSLWSFSSVAIGYGVLADQLLELQISDKGPTRIAIEKEKIDDVFAYPAEAVKITLHPSGFALIVPDADKAKQVYVTLIGANGTTQDLRLRFVSKQPEPIKLVTSNVINLINMSEDEIIKDAQHSSKNHEQKLTTKKGKKNV
jgi:hypothetical protein